MHKWFELNWLRKENKHISLPELVFDGSGMDSSACYYLPTKKEFLIGSRFYDCKNGIIVLNISKPDDCQISSLAHEWRHHMQYYYNNSIKATKWQNKGDYKKEIINYFTNNIWEMDALLYEVNKASDDINLQWYEWIIKNENKQ